MAQNRKNVLSVYMLGRFSVEYGAQNPVPGEKQLFEADPASADRMAGRGEGSDQRRFGGNAL